MNEAPRTACEALPRGASLWWLGAVLLVLVAVALRGVVMGFNWPSLEADPDSYRAYANSLAAHGDFLRNGHPSAWRPPLYPGLLYAVGGFANPSAAMVAVLHVVLGAVTTASVLFLARRLGLGLAGLWAGLIVAADPLLVAESAVVMTETLAGCLAAVALWLVDRCWREATVGRAIACGLAVGLSVLCRPTFLPWGVVVLAISCWRMAGRGTAAACLVAAVMTVSPWAIRNWRELGRPIVTTTHGGYTLLLGNNAEFYEHVRHSPGKKWNSERFVKRWLQLLSDRGIDDEVVENRLAYEQAHRTIAENPQDFLAACVYRVRSFWRLAPMIETTGSPEIVRKTIAVWYLAIFLLALVGLAAVFTVSYLGAARVSAGRVIQVFAWLPAGLLILTFSAVHLVYWTDMRMRAPVMPAIGLFAALGGRVLAFKLRGVTRKEFRT